MNRPLAPKPRTTNRSYEDIINQYGSHNTVVNQTDFYLPQETLPWVPHHRPILPALLPRAPGPLVYEGFVPQTFQPGNSFHDDPFDAQIDSYDQYGTPDAAAASEVPGQDNGYVEPLHDPDNDTLEQFGGISESTPFPKTALAQLKRGPGRPRTTGKRGRPKGSGQRGGWSKGIKVGPRAPLQPSEEFNNIHQQAMDAFIDRDDPEQAMVLILQAIAINPEIFSAHALLCEIHMSMGNEELAVTALWMGAHSIARDPEVWQQLIETLLNRTTYNRLVAWRQVSYALARLSKLAPDDHDARYQYAVALQKSERYLPAITQLKRILEKQPYNSSCYKVYSECLVGAGRLEEAVHMYEDAIAHYKATGFSEGDAFEWTDVDCYTSLLARRKGEFITNISESISEMKRLSRWLLNREDEDYWDDEVDDDREWDAEDEPRRVAVDSYEPNQYDIDSYGMGLPLEIRVSLGILRLRQGGHREEALSHFEWLEPEDTEDEANIHQFPDMFLKVGEALRNAAEHQEALRFYEAILEISALDSVAFHLGLGISSYICGKQQQAWDSFEAVLERDAQSIQARTYLSKLHAVQGNKIKAIELADEAVTIARAAIPVSGDRRQYERKEQRLIREAAQVALTHANKMPGPRPPKSRKRKRNNEDNDLEVQLEPTKRRRGAPKTTAYSLAISQERVGKLYDTLEHNAAAMRAGDIAARNIWTECAKELNETFIATRLFFSNEMCERISCTMPNTSTEDIQHELNPNSQEPSAAPSPFDFSADSPIPTIESNLSIPSDFHSISFSTWLDLFLEYALVLANHSAQPYATKREHCYKIINDTLRCALWRFDQTYLLRIYTTRIALCLSLSDPKTLFKYVLPWFIQQYAFSSDPYRLYAAINHFYPWPQQPIGKDLTIPRTAGDGFQNEKLLFSHVASLEHHLPLSYEENGISVPEHMRNMRPETLMLPTHTLLDNSQVTIQPLEMDVVLLILYGQMQYAIGGYAATLQYFFRARALDPENALVCLSIGLCYMHEVHRQVSSRAEAAGTAVGGSSVERNMLVLQGWALFGEYAEKRVGWARKKDVEDEDGKGEMVRMVKREIQFNRARCWLLLGMNDIAVRTLGSALEERDTDMIIDGTVTEERWEKHAAYALANVYGSNGDAGTARCIAQRFLVVE